MVQSVTSVAAGGRPWHARDAPMSQQSSAWSPTAAWAGRRAALAVRAQPVVGGRAGAGVAGVAAAVPGPARGGPAIAAGLSAVVSREWETPAVILVVVVFNAMISFVQERKAEASLQALRDMTIARAVVRRGGAVGEIAAEDLVPGDVVLLEAGDSVPADSRLLEAVALKAQEAALTGESQPVSKDVDVVPDPDAAPADRTNMVFMNTLVTRGPAHLRGHVGVETLGSTSHEGPQHARTGTTLS